MNDCRCPNHRESSKVLFCSSLLLFRVIYLLFSHRQKQCRNSSGRLTPAARPEAVDPGLSNCPAPHRLTPPQPHRPCCQPGPLHRRCKDSANRGHRKIYFNSLRRRGYFPHRLPSRSPACTPFPELPEKQEGPCLPSAEPPYPIETSRHGVVTVSRSCKSYWHNTLTRFVPQQTI